MAWDRNDVGAVFACRVGVLATAKYANRRAADDGRGRQRGVERLDMTAAR